MIKRRFFRVEHGEGDAPSSASSSDEEEAEKEERDVEDDDEGRDDSNEEDGGGDEKVSGEPEESGPQSGYESEESSGNDIDCNPSEEQNNADGRSKHASIVDEDSEKGIAGASQIVSTTLAISRTTTSPSQPELLDCVIRLKSVFKCKLCPKIICLSEETTRTHLKSKRHGRSEKLFKEGRLKFMLNDNGEIVEETETHAERHARTVVAAQNAGNQKNKKNKGRQRQRTRMKEKELTKKGIQEVKEKSKVASRKKRQKFGD